MRKPEERLALRKAKIRKRISGTKESPRLSIYRGQKNIYSQLINHTDGTTLVAASTLSPELKGKLKSNDTVKAAQSVAELIAKKAIEKNIKKVVFDRSGHVYHGRVKAFAEAARKAGLEF